jgi:Ni2+-binding GTPase involved in maturation of urease and hydrogenase
MKLVLVGGFLGAGKTTWLLAAAARLQAMGKRTGLVLNDQGHELVDVHTARAAGFDTEQVDGGCFCCRLSDFVRAAKRLPEADVILAEPVGSCADLVATVIRPLGRDFSIAPLTVLADRRPEDPLLAYLFERQLAEADIVLLSKADLNPPMEGIRGRPVSAVTSEGLDDWLETVLAGEAGSRAVDIDYALYAKAEAALAWLDWHADLRLRAPLTPAAVAGPLLADLDEALTRAGARIAHLKVFDEAGGEYVKASICRNGDPPLVDGALDAPPAPRHDLVLNLRAEAAPEALDAVLDECLARIPGRPHTLQRACFRPGAPVPEQRITETP